MEDVATPTNGCKSTKRACAESKQHIKHAHSKVTKLNNLHSHGLSDVDAALFASSLNKLRCTRTVSEASDCKSQPL